MNFSMSGKESKTRKMISFNNCVYSLFFLMGIFLKHLWLIPNILKWQSCKIFTKLVPSRAPSKNSHRRYSVKKDILKNLQNFTGKHLYWSLNFIKKKLKYRCFWVKFAKFLRTPTLKNICERLLLSFLGL